MPKQQITPQSVERISNAVVRESLQMKVVVTRMATIEAEARELLQKASVQKESVTPSARTGSQTQVSNGESS